MQTHRKQEVDMADMFQDVVSLVCMSTFLVATAMWIGAL
jgi:hypothetical protein